MLHHPNVCPTVLALLAAAPPLVAQSPATTPPGEEPVPAAAPSPALKPLITWADWSGDGVDDAWIVQPDGSGLLLESNGRGGFHDRTAEAGLAEVRGAHMATWADVNGDGRLDLYLPAWRGTSRLFVQQEGGTFADTTRAAGLPPHAEPVDAAWIDFDTDGVPDLHLVTLVDDLVYRNLGNGLFEKVDLGLEPRDRSGLAGGQAPRTLDEARALIGEDPSRGTTMSSTLGGSTSIGVASPGSDKSGFLVCADAVLDQATGVCVMASSNPTLGMLYPVSQELFIDPATGFVGLGTTSPSSRLSVEGSVGAERYVSTVGTGTPPFSIASRTLVDLLNADFLDGLSSGDFRQTSDPITGGDIAQAGAATGQALKWNGTSWVPGNDLIGGSPWNLVGTTLSYLAGRVGIGTNSPSMTLQVDGDVGVMDTDVKFRAGINNNDHGAGWYGLGKLFAGTNVDGPVLYGFDGGALGSRQQAANEEIALRWTAAGDVGIGTESPRAALHVVGNNGLLAEGGGPMEPIPREGVGTRMMWYSSQAAFRVGRVLNDSWDDINIGRYSVAFGLSTKADGEASLATGRETAAGGFCATAMGFNTEAAGFGTTATGTWNIGSGAPAADRLFEIGNGVSPAERHNAVTVLRNGNVGIATPSPQAHLHLLDEDDFEPGILFENYDNDIAFRPNQILQFGTWDGTTYDDKMRLESGGNLRIEGSYLQLSDKRLKTDIQPLENALDKVLALDGVSYRWDLDAKPGASEEREIGFLAQAVADVFPELTRRDDEGWMAVNYASFAPIFVEAIQEQQTEIDDLRAANAELEARLARIEAALSDDDRR